MVNLVASPKQTGSKPVARGSSVPVCPAFSAVNRRRTFCSAVLELSSSGLSNSRTPSSGRVTRLNCSVFFVTRNRLIDQLRKMRTALDGGVIHEMQLGRDAQLHGMRQLAAHKTGGAFQT